MIVCVWCLCRLFGLLYAGLVALVVVYLVWLRGAMLFLALVLLIVSLVLLVNSVVLVTSLLYCVLLFVDDLFVFGLMFDFVLLLCLTCFLVLVFIAVVLQ